jgi:phosphotransferase system enzyme I (PtsI)
MTIDGIGITQRTGAGTVHWYRPDEPDLPDPEGTPEEELDRFHGAKEQAEDQLRDQQDQATETVGEDEADIFGAHIQFLNDPQIEESVTDNIDDGMSAEQAVHAAFEDPIRQYEDRGGRTAERADDLRDVRDRLLRILTGDTSSGLGDVPDGSVVLAERLTPSDTAQMDPDKIKGIATQEGGETSHAAIIARSLGIPAVIGVGPDLASIEDGETVVIDGREGQIITDPSDERLAEARQQDEVDVIEGHVEAGGQRVEVAANVANPAELERAAAMGADGIGLYRTEFMFIDREEPPTEDEHYDNYVQALEAFPGERIVIRTLDIGGDKPVPYVDLDPGENPFLGVRGIRLSLGEGEELFRTQLRALLRAAATEHGDDLAVMFPLVASVEELEEALAIVDDVADELEEEGQEYAVPELGIMVETPAAVLTADEMADRVEFLSIGTNDLTQYIMAASRTDSRVASLQDPLYPAVLRGIAKVIEDGHDAGAWVGMCGEMAGNPRLTELLVGLGLDELSMAPPAVPRAKANVQDIERETAEKKAEEVLAAATRGEVQSLLDQ